MKQERKFGWMIALVLFAAFATRWWKTGEIRIWIPIICFALIFASELAPQILRWPLKLWLKLGDAISWFTQPVILAILYFFVITPIGLFRRNLGKSKLDLEWTDRETYWLKSKTKKLNMRKQF